MAERGTGTVAGFFRNWRNVYSAQNGTVAFFPRPSDDEVFADYYRRIFERFASPELSRVEVFKKNQSLIAQLRDTGFGRQDPMLNRDFWGRFQAYCAKQQSRTSDPIWKQYIDFSSLMTLCWDSRGHVDDHLEFYVIALRQTYLLLPDSVSESELAAHENRYGVPPELTETLRRDRRLEIYSSRNDAGGYTVAGYSSNDLAINISVGDDEFRPHEETGKLHTDNKNKTKPKPDTRTKPVPKPKPDTKTKPVPKPKPEPAPSEPTDWKKVRKGCVYTVFWVVLIAQIASIWSGKSGWFWSIVFTFFAICFYCWLFDKIYRFCEFIFGGGDD